VIVLVTGPLGSGKSYYAVRKIVDAAESGKAVATNVPLVEDWPKRVANHHPLRWVIPGRRRELREKLERSIHIVDPASPDGLQELFRLRLHGRGESRGVMVLDEAHQWLNARLWRAEDRLEIVSWFRMTRKLGWDVYLISQDAESIDRQVRAVFEYHAALRNLRRMKVAGIPVSPINLFLAIWQWHSAGKAVVKREMFKLNYTKRLYDTMGLHGVDDAPEDALWLPRTAAPAPAAPPASASGSAPEARAAAPPEGRSAAERQPAGVGGSSNSPPALTSENRRRG
jgi:adenosyl cobinamide kinase/adenosyl cobinamide phosphate guanylyltransferase